MKKRILTLTLALLMLVMLFAGCGGTTDSGDNSSSDNSSNSSTAADNSGSDSSESNGDSDSVYPLSTDGLSYSVFYNYNDALASQIEDIVATSAVLNTAADITGVTLEFSLTTGSTYSDQLNIMVSAGEYTDLFYDFNYTNGYDEAVEQEIIYDLTDDLETYAPNYVAAINEYPDVKSYITTTEGRICGFSRFTVNPVEGWGPIIRQDWLDDLGLDVPSTYDELENVLLAFATEKGASAPMFMESGGSLAWNWFSQGYGIATYMGDWTYCAPYSPFYQVNGTIHYGLVEDAFYDYISMVSRWASEGLFGNDYASNTMPFVDSGMITSGETGFWYSSLDTASWEEAAEESSFAVSAIPDVALNAGDTLHVLWYSRPCNANGWCISTAVDDYQTAMQYLDFWYTEEGTLLANYGTEESGSLVYDGSQPTLADFVVNGTDEMSNTETVARYTGSDMLPYIRDTSLTSDEPTLAASAIWTSNLDSAYDIPTSFSLTADESTDFANKYNDILTYATENVAKFVSGGITEDQYQAFVDQLYSMGLQDCIDIYQTAYDRLA